MTLSREDIHRAIDARASEAVPVEVPEWGGQVLIARLPFAEISALGITEGGSLDLDRMVRLLARCLVDADHNRLFTDEEAARLAEADFAAFVRVYTGALRVNGLLSAEVEEMVARFVAAQPGAASSG